jgi:hypothetical protein
MSLLIMTSLNQTFAQGSPVEHMNKIQAILEKSKDEMHSYLKAITKGRSAKKIDTKRQNLLNQIVAEINELKVIGSYNGDASLKAASLVYLQLQKTILKDDYGKIMDLEELAEKSYDDMEMYLLMQEKANEKLHEGSDSFDVAYKAFAATYEVTLLEGELDKKSKRIKKMSETLHYYHEAFLIQLKCFHQERYILEAMAKGDMNAIQQNISAQTALVDESMVKLDAMKPYEGDHSLIGATRKLLNFFKREAEGDFTQMLDFYVKKDNFETVKKNFDAKSKSERDKEAVDEYNNAINDFNAAVKTYNELNNKANKERASQNDAWNDAANDFNQEHSK